MVDVLVDDVEGDEVDVVVEASVVGRWSSWSSSRTWASLSTCSRTRSMAPWRMLRRAPRTGQPPSLQAVAATRATPTTSATTRSLTRPTYVTTMCDYVIAEVSTTRLRPRNSAITVVPVGSARSTVTS